MIYRKSIWNFSREGMKVKFTPRQKVLQTWSSNSSNNFSFIPFGHILDTRRGERIPLSGTSITTDQRTWHWPRTWLGNRSNKWKKFLRGSLAAAKTEEELECRGFTTTFQNLSGYFFGLRGCSGILDVLPVARVVMRGLQDHLPEEMRHSGRRSLTKILQRREYTTSRRECKLSTDPSAHQQV